MGDVTSRRDQCAYSTLRQRGVKQHIQCVHWHLIGCTDFTSSVPLDSQSGTSLSRRSRSSPNGFVLYTMGVRSVLIQKSINEVAYLSFPIPLNVILFKSTSKRPKGRTPLIRGNHSFNTMVKQHIQCVHWHLIGCTDFTSSVPLDSQSGTSLSRRSRSSPNGFVLYTMGVRSVLIQKSINEVAYLSFPIPLNVILFKSTSKRPKGRTPLIL